MAAGQPFLQELREFLAFLHSLWGLLAGISILFPLSNVLFTTIPLELHGEPLFDLSPGAVTAATMVTCVFLTFATFGRRDTFREPARRDHYHTVATVSFAGALGALFVYLTAPSILNDELGLGRGPASVTGRL